MAADYSGRTSKEILEELNFFKERQGCLDQLLAQVEKKSASELSQQWNVVDVEQFINLLANAQSRLRMLIENQRTAYREAGRPFARVIHIRDLPFELLVMIFTLFNPETYYSPRDSSPNDECRPDVKSIQNVRLTCSLFRGASDDLLLRCVDVEIMCASLDRLDEISLHPTISKGVHMIRIDLCFYSRMLATNESDYIDYACDELEPSLDSLRSSARRLEEQGAQDTLNLTALIAKAKRILAVWMKYKETQTLPRKNLKSCAAIKAIISGHQEYHRQYTRQSRILEDGFAQRVAKAIRRMPKVTSLLICGQSVKTDNLLVQSYGSRKTIQQAICQIIHYPFQWTINPMSWAVIKERPDETLPTEMLWQLPIEFFRAGVQLKQLEISLFPSLGPPTTRIPFGIDFKDQDIADLRASVQELELFRYIGPVAQPGDGQTNFVKYMQAMFSRPRLARVTVYLLAYLVEDGWALYGDVPIKPLFASTTSRQLACRLSGGLLHSIEEIQEILHKFPSVLILDGTLLREGNWEQTFDLLRSRT